MEPIENEYQVEILRRSVAMLSPQQWAFTREQALQVLDALVLALRDLRRMHETEKRQAPRSGTWRGLTRAWLGGSPGGLTAGSLRITVEGVIARSRANRDPAMHISSARK